MDPDKIFNSRSEFEKLFRAALGLPRTDNSSSSASYKEYTDVLFVCFDFENGQQFNSHAASGRFSSNKILAQAGMSIFDPRTLFMEISKAALTTFNFGFGGSPSHKRNVDRRFFFGETTWLSQFADLLISIENLLDRSRKIVLVGHGLNGDCKVLQSLGFDFGCSIVGYIDTAEIASVVLNRDSTSMRLKDLLAKLGLVVEGCHVAGNDANFTLRALLRLSVKCFDGEGSLSESTKETLQRLSAIGLESLPRLLPPPNSRAAKKSKSRGSDAPIRCGGWVIFGHLPEIFLIPLEIAPAHLGSSKILGFQLSPLLLQWCPRLGRTMTSAI